jgi:DNA invertase Pin-like site-specific DNA recombinase
MNKSELLTAQHLARKAIIYLRQSTPHQVLTNQESLRLQYALKQKAISLGWQPEDIEVIDCDLGLTGSAAEHREGFKEVVTKVTLGQVGIILSIEVARLSRNCSDWYPLLDICGWKGCLIADRDGIYDPATANGRLLLGIKGTLSELELHTLRGRLNAGLLNKAQRGELALSLPIGLIRDETGRVQKNPDLEVQNSIEMVFKTFLELKTINKVVRFFNNHGICLPGRNRLGDLVWRKPGVASISSILKNPAYGGAFVYGRSRVIRNGPSVTNASIKRLPMDEWKIRVNDKYPPYVSWETFEKIQAILKDNHAEYERNKTRGIPRPGAALLHGLVYCGACAHKMVVQYKGSSQYICNALRQQYQVPVCQNIPAAPVDEAVVEAFFEALSPLELDLYSRAMIAKKATDEKIDQAHLQQIERLRYQAALAERQFNRTDPDNRLVAAELERRWESSLRELKEAQQAFQQLKQKAVLPFILTAEEKAAFAQIGKTLPQLWDKEVLPRQTKKALLRSLIDKIVIHRLAPDLIQVRIIWRGGEATILKVTTTVGSFKNLSQGVEMEKLILNLTSKGKSDSEIAQYLTNKGFRSPMKSFVLESTVKTIRLKHRLLLDESQSHPRHVAGYLTVTELARTLDVPLHWIYDRIHNSTIEVARDPKTNLYLFPNRRIILDLFKKLKANEISKISCL